MTAYNGLHKKEDMLGKRFSKWTVLEYSHKNEKSGNWYYKCRCDCGNESVVIGTNLRTGSSMQCKSCSSKINGKKGVYATIRKDLYFIKCGNYIKIGVSDNVQRRLNDLKASNPLPLELIYFGKGEGRDEEMWHKVFAHRHHHGEWYEF